MRNFSKVFQNELIKVNSNYRILKLCIAILVLFIIVTFSFNFIIQTIGDYVGGLDNITPQQLDAQIAMLETQISEMKNSPDSSAGIADNTLYNLESKLTLLKYVRTNDINLANKALFGTMSIDSAGFIFSIMDLTSTILVVFAVVMAVTTFHQEKSNGTLKMQMLRPVNRSSFLFAKMLSIWVVSIGVYFVFLVLSQIVAIAKFGTNVTDVIYVLNANKAGEMSYFAYLAITFFVDIIEIWIYMQLAYFLSSLLWKKESIMGLTIVIVLLGPMLDGLLNYAYIGYIGFFNNLDYLSALNPTQGPTMKGANLYTMLAITLVYQALMTAYTFLHFKKCDIA